MNPITQWLACLAGSIVVMTLPVSRACGQAPAWQAAASLGHCTVTHATADAAGNQYVGGYFRGTLTYGPTTLTNVGYQDVFVAKFTSAGACLWAAQGGGAGVSKCNQLAVDSSGTVYLTGNFDGPTAAFGSTTLTNFATTGSPDIFVAKLSPAGQWQWAAQAGGTDQDYGYAIALDRSGDVVIGGTFLSPTAAFGSLALPNSSPGTGDLFVARLSSAGVWQWFTGAVGTGAEECTGLATDRNGDLVVIGSFLGTSLTLGGSTLTNQSQPGPIARRDAFVARLDPSGRWSWVQSVDGTGDERCEVVVTDRAGNTYVAGHFSSPTVSFGATPLTNRGANFSDDAFVAKLTPLGNWQWAAGAGGAGYDGFQALALDATSNVYVTGWLSGATATVGTTVLTNTDPSYNDVLVAKLTPAGIWRWARSAGGLNQDVGRGIVPDANGDVTVTGTCSAATVTFGSIALTNLVGSNSFSARLAAPTALPEHPSSLASFTLSPNPARESVTLSSAPAPTLLLDALGRTVRTYPAGTTTLDLRGLAPGLYTVRAGAATRRLVVE